VSVAGAAAPRRRLNITAPWLMVLASLLFALMGVCVKYAAVTFSAAELVFWRSLGTLAMSALLLMRRGLPLATTVQPAEVRESCIVISPRVHARACSIAWSQSARSPSRNPSRGRTRFMLPAMGSTITAAIASGCARNAPSTASRSLNATTMVSPAIAGGTPADEGCPNVSAPEPAFTSRLSP